MPSITVHDGNPAVNVKTHGYNFPTAKQVMAEFPGITTEQAEKALEITWEAAQQDFWQQWSRPEEYGHHFPVGHLGEQVKDSIKVQSGGRSDGWLEVTGIPERSLKALLRTGKTATYMQKCWLKFEADVHKNIEWRHSEEYVFDFIRANGLCDPPTLKFTLSIELGNDAMQTPGDIAEALRKVAAHLTNPGNWEQGPVETTSGSICIMDTNGNGVGQFRVTQ